MKERKLIKKDFEITFKLPLTFNKVKVKNLKLGKEFVKKILKNESKKVY